MWKSWRPKNKATLKVPDKHKFSNKMFLLFFPLSYMKNIPFRIECWNQNQNLTFFYEISTVFVGFDFQLWKKFSLKF